MLPGFPKRLPSDGASSPVLVDLDGDNRNELVFGTSDGYVHALRRDGSELPGWPVRTRPAAAAHRPARLHQRRGRRGRLARRDPGSLAAPTSTTTACPRWSPPTWAARSTPGTPTARCASSARRRSPTPASRCSPSRTCAAATATGPSTGSSARRCWPTSTATAATSRSIAANMDRHVYAWHANGTPVDGFPVLVIDRSKIDAIDPQTHAPTFNASAGAGPEPGRDRRHAGGRRPHRRRASRRSWSARTRSTRPTADGGLNAGT